MSSTIDERVVKMSFESQAFEAGVSKALDTMQKLKSTSFNTFEGMQADMDLLQKSAAEWNLDGMSESLDECASKFGAFEGIIGDTFSRIQQMAMGGLSSLFQSAVMKPMTDGFHEYELQMNSVQTILSNAGDKLAEEGYDTQEKKIARINETLDDLNTYADKTIYNFAEMTRNIGTFTAAGVDLDTATSSIKGIANLAAASGSNSEQASRAMYQLSQAIAAGSLKLQDWNSVMTAGLGGELFQNALKRTARAHGIAVDEMIAKAGSFRESLSEGWITSEVLTDTLQQLTIQIGDYGYETREAGIETLKAQGYTEDEANAILDLAQNAYEAATEVRTWSQLWGTVGEALGSGWSATWRLIVGDFIEATELFTFLNEQITGIIDASSNARNEVLAQWADAGGRTALVDGIQYLVNAIIEPIKVLGAAFSDVFGITGRELFYITTQFATFAEGLVPSKEAIQFLYDAFYNVFTVIHSVLGVVGNVIRIFVHLAGVVWAAIAPLRMLAVFISGKLLEGIARVSAKIHVISDAIEEFVDEIAWNFTRFFSQFGQGIADAFGPMIPFAGMIHDLGLDFLQLISPIGDFFMSFAPIRTVFEYFSNFRRNLKSLTWDIEGFIDSFAGTTKIVKDVETGVRRVESVESVAHKLGKSVGLGIQAIASGFNEFANAENKFEYAKNAIMDGFNAIKESVASFMHAFSGPQELSDALELLYDNVSSWIYNTFGDTAVYRFIDEFWYTLTEPLFAFSEAFLWESNTWSDVFSKIGAAIKGFISGAISKLPGPIQTAINAIKPFYEIIKNLAGQAITQLAPNFKSVFESIKNVFNYGDGNISNELGQLSFDNVKTNFDNLVTFLSGIPGKIATFVGGIKDKIVEFFNGIDWDNAFEKIKKFGVVLAKAGVAVSILKFIRSITSLNKTISSFGKGIIDFPSNVGDALSRFGEGFRKKETKADAILKVAGAIGVLALSLLVIASLPTEDLQRAGMAMGIMAGGIAALFLIFGALDKMGLIKSDAIANIGKAIAGLGIGVLALSAACLVISQIPVENIAQGLAGCFVLIIACAVFARGLGENGGSMLKGAIGMVIFAGALMLMMNVVKELGAMELTPLFKGILGFVAVVGALTVFGYFAAEAIGTLLASFLKFGAGLLLAAIAVGVFAKNLGKLDKVLGELKHGWTIVFAFAGVLIGFVAAVRLLKDCDPESVGDGLRSFVTGIALLAVVFFGMQFIDFNSMVVGLVALGVGLGLFIAAAKYLDPDNTKEVAKGMVIFAGAVGIMAGALTLLRFGDTNNLIAGGIAIGLLAGEFALISAKVDPTNLRKTAVSMVIFSAAVGVMAGAFTLLRFADFDTLIAGGIAIGVLAGGFALIAALVDPSRLQEAALAMVIFSGALGIMAVGLLAISLIDGEKIAGMLALIMVPLAALAIMSLAGEVIGAGMIAISAGFAAFSGALVILGIGLNVLNSVDFALMISNVQMLGSAIAEMGSNVLEGIRNGLANAPAEMVHLAFDMARNFIQAFKDELGIASPSTVMEENGEFAIDGFIEGAGGKISELLGLGEEGALNFEGGFDGLAGNLGTKANEALNGFLDGLDVEQLKQRGMDMLTGLLEGLDNEELWGMVETWPGKFFDAIVNGVKTYFGINSPSTVMRDDVGSNIIQGLIDGLNKFDELTTTATNMGTAVLDGLRDLPGNVLEKGKEVWNGMKESASSKSGEITNEVNAIKIGSVNKLSDFSSLVKAKTDAAMKSMVSAITSTVGTAKNAMTSIVSSIGSVASGLAGTLRSYASSASSAFVSGIEAAAGRAAGAASSLVQSAKSGMSSLYDSFYNVGSNGGLGFIRGIDSMINSAANKAAELAKSAVKTAKKVLDQNSPSKVFMGIGEGVGEGFVLGIGNETRSVVKSSAKLAGAIPDAFSDTLKDMSYGIDDLINTDYNPVISPVIDPTNFNADLSMLSSSLNSRLASDVAFGTFNYNETFAGKFDELNDTNRLALKAFADGAIDYNALGQSVANALIRSGVHVEMDGGQLMGYLAGEIQDARRMYR